MSLNCLQYGGDRTQLTCDWQQVILTCGGKGDEVSVPPQLHDIWSHVTVRRIQQEIITMHSISYSCQILMKLEFSRQIFEKYSSIKFYENPSSGRRVVTCGRTDRQKQIVAFEILRTRIKINFQEWKSSYIYIHYTYIHTYIHTYITTYIHSHIKVKFALERSHERLEEEQRYKSALSLTSKLNEGERLTPRPGRLIPGKETR